MNLNKNGEKSRILFFESKNVVCSVTQVKIKFIIYLLYNILRL